MLQTVFMLFVIVCYNILIQELHEHGMSHKQLSASNLANLSTPHPAREQPKSLVIYQIVKIQR